MSNIKLPSKELIIAAFCGGTVVSLLELMNMFASHDNVFDPYFWGGMITAGIIGVLGLFISQAKDIGGAITSGIAAPQLLGGMVKAVPVMVSILSMHAAPIYADNTDSIKVTTIIEGTYKILEIKSLNTNKGLLLRDTMIIKLPTEDSLEIIGDQYQGIKFSIRKDTVDKEILIRIKPSDQYISLKNTDPVQSLLRGAFGHIFRKEKTQIQKLELSIEEKLIERK